MDEYSGHYFLTQSTILKPQFKTNSREFVEKRLCFTRKEALSPINNLGLEGLLDGDQELPDTIYQWFSSIPEEIYPASKNIVRGDIIFGVRKIGRYIDESG